jgi:hypothetical protein
MRVNNFAAWNEQIWRFKDCQNLVYKKLPVKSATINTDKKDLWIDRLPVSLERHELWDIYNVDWSRLFYIS